ncbi:hypothetical protein [Sphingorhabdus contaminans]|uniref:hypothetical protein n=1 Tax=Sphingorhabdus contaminans TaxID=1343899 RepID=UPI003D2CEC8E
MMLKIAWLVLAAVHATPALAFFRPATLTTLYRLDNSNPLFLLMHHRAALFFAVFALCLWSAFDSQPRRAAVVLTAISMLSFLALYFQYGSPRPLKTIALIDLAGLPFLCFVAWKAFSR